MSDPSSFKPNQSAPIKVDAGSEADIADDDHAHESRHERNTIHQSQLKSPSKPKGDSRSETPRKEEAPKKEVKEETRDKPKEEPKKEAPKEEPKKEVPKEEPKKEAPKEEPKKEAPKEEPKKEITKEEPKKEVHQEEVKREALKEEPKVVETKKPVQNIVLEEAKQNAPPQTEEVAKDGLVVLKPKPIEEAKSAVPQSGSNLDESNQNASHFEPGSKSGSSRLSKSSTRVTILDDNDNPNYQRLRKRIDDCHARNNNNEPYSKWEAFWKFSTGWHSCISTSKTCDADKFGIGMVLYFRFLKFMAFFFFIAGILSVPILFFSVQAANRWSSSPTTSYKTGLYATTLGPIAEASSYCTKGKIGDPLKFTCPAGTIGKFSFFQYGRITETTAMSCDHYSYYSWDTQCNSIDSTNTLETQYNNNCLGQTSCSITVTADFFNFSPAACKPWFPASSEYKADNLFYFQVLCQDINFQVASGLPASKTTVGLIIASIDCFITLLYIYFLFTIKKLERKAIENMMINNKPIETHTIEVKSLPHNLTIPQLRAKLWDYFNRELMQGKRKFKANVVDVQIAEPNKVLHLEAELANIRHNKVKAYRKFYTKYTEKNKSPLSRDIDIEDLKEVAKNVPAEPKDKKKRVMKDLQSIEKLLARQAKIEAQIKVLKNNEKSKAVSAFITFEKQEQRDAMHSIFQRSPLAHFFFPLCCCGYKNDPCVFEKKYIRVCDAPAPDDIIWKNVEVRFVEKFIRRFISWALTFGFWVISFALMTYVRNQQEKIADSLKPGYCTTYPDVKKQQAMNDKSLGSTAIGLLDCYCTQAISRVFNDDDCSYLQSKVITSNSLPFLIVVAIILINFVLQVIFRALSGFERHRSATSESVSRIIKIFVAQALNTGVIILIVNAKFANTTIPNVLAGTYDDVSPAWFTDVAVTLLITMLINIASLPVMTGIFRAIYAISRCCDRGCTRDMTKTKKKSQIAWENLYMGPEFFIEFRYAQILTVIFVCQLYASGIPLLFVSTFWQLTMFYFLDKYFLLRIYRTPRRFDGKLQGMIVNALFLALILHLGNAVWIFGNLKIFGDSASLSVASDVLASIKERQAPGIFQNLISRAFQNQNLSLAALFALVVIGFLINLLGRKSLSSLFDLCAKKIKRSSKEDVYKDDNEAHRNSYYGRIKTDAIKSEIKYLTKEIEGLTDDRLKTLIQEKLDKFRNELTLRLEGSPMNLDDKFHGIFSYHISHNPEYKRFFEIQGFVENISAIVPQEIQSIQS